MGQKCEKLSLSKSSQLCPIERRLNEACRHFADGPPGDVGQPRRRPVGRSVATVGAA